MCIARLNGTRGNRVEIPVWITGVRRHQQNDSREKTKIAELYHFDVLRDLYIVKLNPMAAWTRDQVQDYIKKHDLLVNALAALGSRSIGCQPCSRPTADGENERAGRWTGFDKSECGIHTFLGSNIWGSLFKIPVADRKKS